MTKLLGVTLAAIFIVLLDLVPAAAQQGNPPPGVLHRPMQPYRNHDGSFKRLRGVVTTTSWSGYAVKAAAPYKSASATWQVPDVAYDGGKTPYGYEYVFDWVGVGGYGDSTLIQLGTESVISTAGAKTFYAWYELYPAVSQLIALPVKPGDIVTTALACTAACTPAQTQTWHLTLTDATQGWSWAQNFQYHSSMASAEWITEPPYYNGTLPLADYGEANYDPVTANGANPNLSLAANGIIAMISWGQTSNPSPPVGGDAFGTCWGKTTLTPCTAGSITPPPPVVTATLTANPKSIAAGQSSTLSWRSTNATSCAGSGFPASGTSGSAVVSPAVTTAYSVTCTDGQDPATAMTTVTVGSPGGTTCRGKKCR